MKFRVVYYRNGRFVIEYRYHGWFKFWERLEYYDENFNDWVPYIYYNQQKAVDFAKNLTKELVEKLIVDGNSKIKKYKTVYI